MIYAYKIPYNIKTFSRSDKRCGYNKKSRSQHKRNSSSKSRGYLTIYADAEEWEVVFNMNDLYWE